MLTVIEVPRVSLSSALPPQSVVDIGLKDLLNFLQQHETENPKLRMMCPWNGVPLPSIDITPGASRGFSGKIELSVQWTLALMQYVDSARGNVPK